MLLTDDSDEDDVFLSTAKDQNIGLLSEDSQDTEVVEEPQKTQSKKKPITKYAAVKKLLKMNIQVNQRVVFDEEGEEILDPRKQQVITGHFNYQSFTKNIPNLTTPSHWSFQLSVTVSYH